MKNKPPLISIVVLTYNRKDRVEQHVKFFAKLSYNPLEIIFVDNFSDERIEDVVSLENRAYVIRNSSNSGAVGRNSGILEAKGEIIITLDDDVYGLTDQQLFDLVDRMDTLDIAAVNFRIQEEGTLRIINWCHPYCEEKYSDQILETMEISEGAVAFRREAIQQVGVYPEYFFISHEGPDLAFRFINAGWRLIYCPSITVTHACDPRSRPSWRRYYYDTRNQLWLVLRNMPFWYGVKYLTIGWGAMFIYALRDGFVRYWLKAIWDSIRAAPRALGDRTPPTPQARRRWRIIQREKPGFWEMARKRLFCKGVRI